jgi:hypothetical protein
MIKKLLQSAGIVVLIAMIALIPVTTAYGEEPNYDCDCFCGDPFDIAAFPTSEFYNCSCDCNDITVYVTTTATTTTTTTTTTAAPTTQNITVITASLTIANQASLTLPSNVSSTAEERQLIGASNFNTEPLDNQMISYYSAMNGTNITITWTR